VGVAGTFGTAGTSGGVAGTGVGGTSGPGTGGRGGNPDGGPVDGGDGGITPCTPTNCADGCCSGNTCVRARTAKLCGANGATCAPCGGCQICSMGMCRVDGASRWTIVAASAQLPTFMSGRAWDRLNGEVGGSAPDPFCEYENPAGQVSTTTAGVTDTINDTFNPTWNQTITPVGATVAASTLMSNNPTWQVWVGDDDGCNSAGCFADVACTIRQPITEAQLRAGQLVITNHQSCNSVTLNFVCAAPVTAGGP
jgi:hypothetical protein